MAPPDPDPSPETIEAAARGDARAFEAIVRRFERPVWSLAHRLTGDRELARDVAQEVFLRVYKNLARYDPSRPFAPWFLKVATYYALNAREAARLRRTTSLDAGANEDDPAPATIDPAAERAHEQAARDELRDEVRRAIGALDARYAGPIALFYLEGLDVKAIAARLDLPEGTVKIRLHRGRDLLKRALGKRP